jgi:CheY-like chemotaxis protein
MTVRTCLLIEDSQTQARVIGEMITQCRWSVLTTLDLAGGICVLQEQAVDLVITDLLLPDCPDGGAVGQVRAIVPGVIVAAISAGGGKSSAASLLQRAREQGAEFLLNKPFSKDRLQVVLAEVEARLAGAVRKPHAMVVDPSRTIGALCARALGEAGFRVSAWQDLAGALETLDPLDLDVLLVDRFAAEGCDLETLSELREMLPGVGVVAMAGADQGGALRRALERSADVALAKPFTGEELAGAVRRASVLAAAALLARTSAVA